LFIFTIFLCFIFVAFCCPFLLLYPFIVPFGSIPSLVASVFLSSHALLVNFNKNNNNNSWSTCYSLLFLLSFDLYFFVLIIVSFLVFLCFLYFCFKILFIFQSVLLFILPSILILIHFCKYLVSLVWTFRLLTQYLIGARRLCLSHGSP
jgi:hypothetical protein